MNGLNLAWQNFLKLKTTLVDKFNDRHMDEKRTTTANSGLAKVAVQCSADSFVVNQTFVLRINICGKIATFAKPQTVKLSKNPKSLLIINTLIVNKLSKFILCILLIISIFECFYKNTVK